MDFGHSLQSRNVSEGEHVVHVKANYGMKYYPFSSIFNVLYSFVTEMTNEVQSAAC